MKKILKNALKTTPLLMAALSANAEVKTDFVSANALCYSAYHLEQDLELQVNFGGSVEQQKTKIDVDLHVREVLINKNRYSNITESTSDKEILRSYVFLVSPNSSKTNGVVMDMKQRYLHPFVVVVDGHSGKLIDIKSTEDDEKVLSEYRSFYDIFQYSNQAGEYRYINANGRYQAVIQSEGDSLIKRNLGYIDNDNKSNLKIEESYLEITADKSLHECFYKKSKGKEKFKSVLSAKAFVKGESLFTVMADANRALPTSHYFYSLASDSSTWPGFEKAADMLSPDEALAKMPAFMKKLSLAIEDEDLFIKMLMLEKQLWQYLPENIMEYGLSDDVSKKLFWALDRIDTKESVSALAKLTTSPLSARDHYRAVLALTSTNAAFDQNSVDILISHLSNFRNPEYAQPENLTFVRLLGAMASQRNATDPQHSAEIRDFLYSQVGSFDDNTNAAVIDAIGNLKGSINVDGESILSNQLSYGSDAERLSAASAFKRIPFNADNNVVMVERLAVESNYEIKNVLIGVLGKSNKSDNQVKQKLINVLDDKKLKQTALKSMKQISYDYQSEEIRVLEESLRNENNSVNQRLLASMIMKHRREQIQ